MTDDPTCLQFCSCFNVDKVSHMLLANPPSRIGFTKDADLVHVFHSLPQSSSDCDRETWLVSLMFRIILMSDYFNLFQTIEKKQVAYHSRFRPYTQIAKWRHRLSVFQENYRLVFLELNILLLLLCIIDVFLVLEFYMQRNKIGRCYVCSVGIKNEANIHFSQLCSSDQNIHFSQLFVTKDLH